MTRQSVSRVLRSPRLRVLRSPAELEHSQAREAQVEAALRSESEHHASDSGSDDAAAKGS